MDEALTKLATYLGDRLGLSGTGERIPSLPGLVGAQPA